MKITLFIVAIAFALLSTEQAVSADEERQPSQSGESSKERGKRQPSHSPFADFSLDREHYGHERKSSFDQIFCS